MSLTESTETSPAPLPNFQGTPHSTPLYATSAAELAASQLLP